MSQSSQLTSTPWPPITVLVYTYDRPRKIRRVLVSLKEHLRYNGELLWRLADDGSPPGYLESIAADFPDLALQWTVTERKGFGANANTGYRARTTKYVLSTEDDLLIVRDLDLNTGIVLMENVPSIGALRYDIANTDLFFNRCILGLPGLEIPYCIIDRVKTKYWNFCGHPTLVQPSIYETYGYLPEGVRVGEVELTWTRRVSTIPGPPDVVILPEYLKPSCFTHIGGASAERLGQTERDAGWMIERGLTPK